MTSSSQSSNDNRNIRPGFLGKLLKPGWDAAETIIPVLHRSLAALLAILLYTAQHSEEHVRVHLLIMSGLTVCLWASVTWFINEYRSSLAKAKQEESTASDGDGDSRRSKESSTSPAPTNIRARVVQHTPLTYTD